MKVSLEIPQLVEILDAIKDMQTALATLQDSLVTPHPCGSTCSCQSSETTPEEEPKKTRKRKAKKVEDLKPEPVETTETEITIADLRAAMNARAAESPEVRSAIIAIARSYHPSGKIAEVYPGKYAEILEKVNNA